MAELLIRVYDKVNPDSIYSDAKCLKAGDVVAVCPDGWAWSLPEQQLSFWRIVKCPGMPVGEAEAYLAPEPGDPLTNKMLQRRQFKFDLTKLDPAYLADDLRAQATTTLDVATVQAAQLTKEALIDPAVIGGNPVVVLG